jgi:hypothetical protein
MEEISLLYRVEHGHFSSDALDRVRTIIKLGDWACMLKWIVSNVEGPRSRSLQMMLGPRQPKEGTASVLIKHIKPAL